jgi:hypothetical protein
MIKTTGKALKLFFAERSYWVHEDLKVSINGSKTHGNYHNVSDDDELVIRGGFVFRGDHSAINTDFEKQYRTWRIRRYLQRVQSV